MDAQMPQRILVEIVRGGRNATIAHRLGCDRRTVRRYRRLAHALDVPVRDLCDLSQERLRKIFNARMPRHEEPDFAALASEFPNTTSRFRYERYRERQRAAGRKAMSGPHFNRLRAEYEFRETGTVRFAPLLPRLSASTAERWAP